MGVVRAYLRLAVGLVDEVILAHAIRTRSDNAWEAAHDGLVLYAQNARPDAGERGLADADHLGRCRWLVFLSDARPRRRRWSGFSPAMAVAGLCVFALIFAWAVKAALIEPFALACLLQVFFKVTEGQEPESPNGAGG